MISLPSRTVPTLTISSKSSPGKAKILQAQRLQFTKSGLAVPCTKCQPCQNRQPTQQPRSTVVVCAAALCRACRCVRGKHMENALEVCGEFVELSGVLQSARCAAEQTQTVTRESSTITIAPIQGKERSPELDDGGAGFPPRDDGDGGGGGGGGGHHWSGGFFFFGLLAFLGFLKDQESEGPYRDSRRR